MTPILRVLSLPVLAAVALALMFTPSAGAQGPQNISVVLIIDNSGSMARTDPASLRNTAASQLVDLLEEGDEIGVVLFSDDSTVLVSLRRVTDVASKEAIKSELTPVAPETNTNMRAGLEAGLAELDKGSNPIRFAIFLTDGELHPPDWPNSSAEEQEAERSAVFALADSFGERKWRLFPISLASAVEPEFLQKLAENGGGLYLEAPEAGELTLVFQEVFAAIKLDVFEVLFSDCLGPGEQASVTFPIHQFVTTLSLFVTYTSDLQPTVAVAGPDGELVTPTGGDIRYDAFSIEGPARGTWTVTITGAGEGESCVSISSTPRTLVEVMWLRPPSSLSLAPGEPLEVAVRLTAIGSQLEDERPVEDAAVTVTVVGPSGQQFEGVLEHSGPGEYAGTVAIDGMAGSYGIFLIAETEEGVVAHSTFQASVSLVPQGSPPSLTPAPTPKPEPASAETDRGGPSTLLMLVLFGPVLLVGLAGSFLAYARFGRPTLRGWLMTPGRLESVQVGRAFDLGVRHRRTWTRRPLTIGGPNDDIDVGLGRRVARVVPRKGGDCVLQAVLEDVVTVDGRPLKKGQRRALYHGSAIDLSGVPLVYREHAG